MSDNGKPLFENIALIGIGLIGSSLCRAIKRANLASRVIGVDLLEETRLKALELGIVDEAHDEPCKAVKEADLIILCTPVGAYGFVAESIAHVMKPGAILSDVGSVKSQVVNDVAKYVPDGVHFIPAHPVAGTEHSGPEAGFAELFDGRWSIITPIEGTDEEALAKLKTFWEKCGSFVEVMSPEHHDLVLAITSHVPHLVAYNIVGTAADMEEVTRSEVIKFSAGGFRDFTRIAASDPVMWRDVFLSNKQAVLEMLGRFSEDLSALQRAIRWDDGDALLEHFSRTREIRRSIIDAGQETDEPDFGRKHS